MHQVSFPCRLEVNSGGGESLYRAAAQHAGLGQEAFKELRRYIYGTMECVQQSFDRICNSGQSNPGRYCHAKLAEWWQWYEPYYAFPIQVFHDSTNHPSFCIDLSLLSNSFMFLCPGEAEGEKCHCSAQHSLSCSIQRIPQERRLLGLLERERVRDLLPGERVRGPHPPAHLQPCGGRRQA